MSLALAKPVASGPASLVPFAPASQRRLIRGAVALQCADETLVRKTAGLHRRLAAAAPSVRGADRADDRACLRRGLAVPAQDQALRDAGGGHGRHRCGDRPGLPAADVAVPPRPAAGRGAGAARAGGEALARDQRGLRPDQDPPPQARLAGARAPLPFVIRASKCSQPSLPLPSFPPISPAWGKKSTACSRPVPTGCIST